MAYTRIIENLVITSTLNLKGSAYDNTLVRNVVIENVKGDGIMLRDVKNVKIENVTIQNVSGDGIKLSTMGATSNVILQNNKILNIGEDGINAGQRITEGVDHPGLKIIENTIHNTGTNGGSSGLIHGMYIQSSDFLIHGNRITQSNDGNGISVRSSGVISDNYIETSRESGIAYYADHKAGPSNTLRIENNIIVDSGNGTTRSDINLLNIPSGQTSQAVKNFVIQYNTLTDNDGNPIEVHSAYANIGANVTISENKVVSDSIAKSAGSKIAVGSVHEGESDDLSDAIGGATLVGGSERDTIIGTPGDDVMTGGRGADTFVFKPNGGHDTVTDFLPEYSDVIRLEGFGLTRFAEVHPLMRQDGSDTLIDLGDDTSITLWNVKVADLAASEFVLLA